MYKWTRMGEDHLRKNGDNEDALFFAESEDYAVCALADGVGSCSQAGRGARLAAEAAATLLVKNGELFMGYQERKAAAFIHGQVQHRLRQEAGGDGIGAYASTLACCLLQKKDGRLMLVSLGDSMIFLVRAGRAEAALRPCDSRYGVASTADRDASAIRVKRLNADEYDDVILCSDGAWRLWVERGRLTDTAERLLVSGDYQELAAWTQARGPQDDSSFMALNRRAALDVRGGEV